MNRMAILEKDLKEQAIEAAVKYYEFKHKKITDTFTPGDRIPYAGRVFDEEEISALIDSSLDFWLTAGRYTAKFEEEFAKFLGSNPVPSPEMTLLNV